jgi:hypothetical protein
LVRLSSAATTITITTTITSIGIESNPAGLHLAWARI